MGGGLSKPFGLEVVWICKWLTEIILVNASINNTITVKPLLNGHIGALVVVL